MAEVRLRFYGRFILAQPRAGGKVSFLAPNMTFKNAIKRRFRRHNVSLCIPRAAVSSKQSTLSPTFRIMSDRDAEFAECLVWDLAGCSVTVPPVDTFSLTFDDPVPDLEELEKLQGRAAKLDPGSLKASKTGKTSAVIEVAAGAGTASASFTNMSTYVTRPDAEDGDPKNDKSKGGAEQHADVVEFVIALPADGILRLEVTGSKGSRSPKYVTIDAKTFKKLDPMGILRASVTSLCPTLPHAHAYDHEFGQYYELLRGPKNDRLIPKDVASAGEGGDCNDPAQITYDP